MISYISGEVFDFDLDSVTILSSGVGYSVHLATTSLELLKGQKTASLYIHTHVREDQLVLFGFLEKQEKGFFLELLKVNGVGPKMAMQILSGARFELIVQMIENEEVSALTKLPKVGKKTAEQMILSLKGKWGSIGVTSKRPQSSDAPLVQQITSALINLGYRAADIDRVKHDFLEAKDLGDGVRQGLRALSGHL